jgi:hypothetical protein
MSLLERGRVRKSNQRGGGKSVAINKVGGKRKRLVVSNKRPSSLYYTYRLACVLLDPFFLLLLSPYNIRVGSTQ